MKILQTNSFALLCAASIALALPLVSVARQDDSKGAVPNNPQTAVASKTAAFAVVKPTDPSVKRAIAATDLDSVTKQIGKSATIQGTVAELFAPGSNSLVVLNFSKEYWTAATVVVRAKNFSKIPNLQYLKGRKVLVTGRVVEYKEKAQIEVSEPGQIKIIK
jgi:DNA/RNA endonuclease YhcR with UshA esterase domain